jgi:hypothetical protein
LASWGNEIRILKIANNDMSRLVEQDIVRVQVTVHDPNRVKIAYAYDLRCCQLWESGTNNGTYNLACIEHHALRRKGSGLLNKLTQASAG